MAYPPLIITPVPKADIIRGNGALVTEFIEGYCRITKESLGGKSGRLLRMRPWQNNILGCVYAKRPDGRFRHRQALIGLPRKNGKSALGSAMGLQGLITGDYGTEIYCLDPNTKILCIDMQWRRCGDLSVNDQIVGFDEFPTPGCVRRFRPATINSTNKIIQPSYRITFSDGRQVVASSKHRWVTRPYMSSNLQRWEFTEDLKPGARIHDLGAPWEFDNSREAGYLAGLLDGEACLVGAGSAEGRYRHGAVLSFAQNPGIVLDRFDIGTKERGFNFNLIKGKCQQRNLRGIREVFRALGTFGPDRLLEKIPVWINGIATNRLYWAEVTKIEFLGDQEVIAIGSSTKTLIADGFFSHNSCAVDKKQAGIVFDVAKSMVRMDPQLDADQGGIIKVWRDRLEYTEKNSFYQVLSSEAITKEGLNPNVVIYDELHGAPDSELYDVMTLAQGARINPLLIAITTAGKKSDTTGQDSTCYKLYQQGIQIANGEIEDDTFFMVWFGVPEDADYRDPEVWEMANPGLGDLLDPESLAADLKRVSESEFRTKHLNQFVAAINTWLPQGAWNACETEREFTPGNRGVVLGFDGSRNRDSTALVAVTVTSNPQVKVLGLWQKPKDADHTWRVPRAEVMDRIRQACLKDFRGLVREIAYDPYLWTDAFDELESEGLPVVEFPQSPTRMKSATQRMYEAVQGRRISHDGNKDLARHFENCQIQADSNGARIVKEKKDSPRKIDLAVATVIALDRADFWLTEPIEPHIDGVPVADIQFVWGNSDIAGLVSAGEKCCKCGNPVVKYPDGSPRLRRIGLQVVCTPPCNGTGLTDTTEEPAEDQSQPPRYVW